MIHAGELSGKGPTPMAQIKQAAAIAETMIEKSGAAPQPAALNSAPVISPTAARNANAPSPSHPIQAAEFAAVAPVDLKDRRPTAGGQ